MSEGAATDLQRALQAAIERAAQARDHYDKLYQQRTGKSGKPIYDIMRGVSKQPQLATLRSIAEVMGLPTEHFVEIAYPAPAATSRAARHPVVPDLDEDVVAITALDLSLSMGPGTFIEEFVEAEPVKMSLNLIQSITRTPSDRLRLVRGIGDSMEPTLRTGDRVMVDINDRQLSRINGIYWIDHLGTHGIKRLRAASRGRIMVISDNPLVPDFESDAEDLRIEGRVIWFAREL